jgi:hypothetical protein
MAAKREAGTKPRKSVRDLEGDKPKVRGGAAEV